MATVPATKKMIQPRCILYAKFSNHLSMKYQASGNAISIATAMSLIKLPDNMATMFDTDAPRTLRTPISLVRCTAVNVARPNNPRQEMTRYRFWMITVSKVKKFKEEQGVFFTESSLFDIFDFKWLAGSPASLKNINSAVLTKTIAEKYFGDWQFAMGKTIKWNNQDPLKITGILADIPENTDLQFKVVISFGTGSTAQYTRSTNWDGTGTSYGCYILLPANVSAASFNTQLRAFAKKMKSPDNKDSHIIQPLSKIHYDTKTGDFSNRTISPPVLRALWLIGALTLLIACVNFINLSTAQAVNRSKEVGIRKVLGSNKINLKFQFITETFLIVLTSVLLAVIIAISGMPFIGKVLAKPISFHTADYLAIALFLVALTIVVTALAGFYPSIVLSRFNPITALKNKVTGRATKGISLRRGLVVFQFVIAQALIIGTLIIVKQMNYFTSQPLGFDKTAIVNIPFPGDSVGISKLGYLHQQLADIKSIQSVSFSSNTPVEDDNDMWSTFKYDHAEKKLTSTPSPNSRMINICQPISCLL